MKTNIIFIFMFFVLISCQSKDDFAIIQDEIQLTSAITPMSRGISSTQQMTQIVENQEIGVTINGAKEVHTNSKWIAQADGKLFNSNTTALYWANTDISVWAYHPYNVSWSGIDKEESFSVSTNQSTDEGYLNSDLLWATKTASKSEDPIKLEFAHKLVKIDVVLLPEYEGTDLSNATISICGIYTTIGFNPGTGELSTVSNKGTIIASITKANAYTGSAIIVPQKIAENTQFIKISHNNKNFYYTLTSETEFKAGNSYSYTLKVKEKEIEVELISSNINDWNKDSNEGIAQEDHTPYLTFTADAAQTLSLSKAVETLEYSVNGGVWTTLGTDTIEFGGSKGKLQLRGKSSIGTAINTSDYANMVFGTAVKVACTGDIRTLVDYENYATANTENARFCRLFEGCTGLTTAPALPATTLASSCYEGMFYGCTSLTTAPALPATTLAQQCYYSMFYGCTSLTSAPALPATTLADYCYSGMFEGCTSLTSAPALPATTLAEWCYSYMFDGCTGLTTAPALPATTLAKWCYYLMFYDCTSLTTAPALPATTLAKWCYYLMFYDCTSLTTAPALPATTLAQQCYCGMFDGCRSLTTAPTLPATRLEWGCYENMFSHCTSLTTAPTLPAKTLAFSCYDRMFYGCTGLTTAPALPATTLAYGCYLGMFWDCTSLTIAPELSARTLAESCYYKMFYGCTKLNQITMLATDISARSCLEGWVSGVASTGTFVKAKTMSSLPTGTSGIPSGWTVKNHGEE